MIIVTSEVWVGECKGTVIVASKVWVCGCQAMLVTS